jgi:hypothetical protein
MTGINAIVGTAGRCYNCKMRPQPLIAVSDVEASSRWYQRLRGCESGHGGPEYERLVSKDVLLLQLHRFDVEHHHGRIGDPADKPYGTMASCSGLRSTISMPPLPVRWR